MQSLGGGGKKPRAQGHPQIPRVLGYSQAWATRDPVPKKKQNKTTATKKKNVKNKEHSTLRLKRSQVFTS